MKADKTRITIFVGPEKAKDLKKRAIDAGLSLSDYLVKGSDFVWDTAHKLFEKHLKELEK